MFGKESCMRCGNKVSNSFDFCPKCGLQLSSKKEEYGMFGKHDFLENEANREPELNLPFGFNTIFNSLMKGLDKQFQEMNKEMMKEFSNKESNSKDPMKNASSIRIDISSFGNLPPRISVKTSGGFKGLTPIPNQNANQYMQENEKVKKELIERRNNFSDDKIQKLLTLPRKEPSTNVKRLSNKVVYEIELPDVKSENDILISQLEKSIEIKAVGKENSYSKLIPVGLPINSHKFSNGKLVLELMGN